MQRIIKFDDENIAEITKAIAELQDLRLRNIVIPELKKYFSVKELVCNHTYDKWKEQSWQFLDTNFLHCLLIIRRDILKSGMVCNTKSATQRGLRCNMCEMVKQKTKNYLSSHIFGKAGDFTVSGMTAEEARQKIKENADLLPCNIRLEKDVTWLHFDVLPQYDVTEKVYFFKG